MLAALSEMAGVLGPMVGASRRYDGPMGKSDRAFVFGALGALGRRSAAAAGTGSPGSMPLLAVLLVVTIVNRVRARPAREAGRMNACTLTADVQEPHARGRREDVRDARRRRAVLPPLARARRRRRAAPIVLFHRGHEHSGRMAHLADELDLPDFAVFAWDARGHGRSPGERGFSPSFGTSVRDVQTFVDHIARDATASPVEDMAVVAQSVGAVLVATWAHDYAPQHPRAWCSPRPPSR